MKILALKGINFLFYIVPLIIDVKCNHLEKLSTLLNLLAAFNALGAILCLCVSIVGCVSLCGGPDNEVSNLPNGKTDLEL